MKKITLLLSSTILSITAIAQSVTYTFDSVKTTSGIIDPSALPILTGVTFGAFSATGTPPNSLAAARFDFSAWATGSVGGAADTLYAGMTGVVSTAEYYEVTIAPQASYALNFDSIQFNFERSATGVRTYAVRSSVDGYAANLTAVYGVPTTNVNVQAGDVFWLKRDITTAQPRSFIILGGASFTNVTTPITFRFYGWNSEAASGTFSIDNVKFTMSAAMATGITEKNNASVSVFPNPSSTGLFTVDAGASSKTIITVYNILGNVVYNKEMIATGKQVIDLSNQANGSYFVNIKKDNEVITKKIMINK
jgi:Secretion system C-terminal sorting domain